MTVAELLQTSGGLALLAETPAASSFEQLVADAVKAGARTIHLEPSESIAKIRYRIDGMLHETSHLSHKALQVLVAHVKHSANLHIDEQRWPQEGMLHLDLGDQSFDIKVATIPVEHGEKAVLHVFDTRHKVHSLEELGLWGDSRKQVNRALAHRKGMIIVSGPHAAGTSTTLRSLLKRLDHPTASIATIEDHIAVRIPRVNQLKIANRQQAASALTAALSNDTDILMIENVQQPEVFRIGAAAAIRGHLIVGGIAAQTLEQTIEHLSALSKDQHTLAHSVKAIIYQRLARRLCDTCKQPAKPSAAELKALSSTAKITLQTLQSFLSETRTHAHVPSKIALYQANPVGCNECRHTGFKGQIGIFEVMPISAVVQRQIAHHANARSIVAQAIRDGMMPTSVDGLIKALSGVTTLREVIYATQ
jgi:type II secretory ATPase GspE/PulE/Tfp pilus assembly ATPase PilB-like protein